MKAECPKCGYVWETRAATEKITCPSCHRNFDRPGTGIEILGTDIDLSTHCEICGQHRDVMNICRVDDQTRIICSDCLSPQ